MTDSTASPRSRRGIGSADDLHASASRWTGLTDFGPDDYRDGLDMLLHAYAEDEDLTEAGTRFARGAIRSALVARSLSEAAWKAAPRSADVAIQRPIVLTGLPRTGTTALHRLLCEDPQHQGLEVWLTDWPQPRPPRASWADNPVYQQLEAAYSRHHVAHPEFMGLHYMSADSVEECWQLLRQSFRSVSFESLAHLPTYSRWLAAQDWTSAYARHHRNLQLIGMNDPGRRWVLKNPSHLFALDALLAVYPDALVVVTHRDPRTVIASASSLSAHAAEGHSTRFTGAVIGADLLELWGRGADQFAAARARYPHEQFLDVQYEDFVADPIGTAVRVYEHAGVELTDATRAAMRTVHEETRHGAAAPAHRYELADFGLSPTQVDERFAAYRAAYRP